MNKVIILALKCCLLWIIVFNISYAIADTQAQSSGDKMNKVGVTKIAFEDSSRPHYFDDDKPRPMNGMVWYPAHSSTKTKQQFFGKPGFEVFKGDEFAYDEKFLDDSKKPLILLSHGTGGTAASMSWLAVGLAKAGYVVAALNHHGNNALEPRSVEGFALWWERAKDLQLLNDYLLSSETWSAQIDEQKIAAAGFSLGGYSVISALGAITDMAQLNAQETPAPYEFRDLQTQFEQKKDSLNIQQSLSRMKDSYQDTRIKAAFIMAPAIASVFTIESLKTIESPVQLVVGEDDEETPRQYSADVLAHNLPNVTEYQLIADAGHYVFLNECTSFGKNEAIKICTDNENIDRKQLHQQVILSATQFFESHF